MRYTTKSRSKRLLDAEVRAAALAAIEPPLDLGTELSVTGFKVKIDETRALLASYNGLLSEAAQLRAQFADAEKGLADLSDRMLAAVGGLYGKTSTVYRQAGGTRKQDRKRPTRKTALSTETMPSAV